MKNKVIGYLLFVIGYLLFVIGYLLLVIDGSSLIATARAVKPIVPETIDFKAFLPSTYPLAPYKSSPSKKTPINIT